jgi:hypothetical protein
MDLRRGTWWRHRHILSAIVIREELLVTQPDLVQEIKGRKAQAPQAAKKRAGRPAKA